MHASAAEAENAAPEEPAASPERDRIVAQDYRNGAFSQKQKRWLPGPYDLRTIRFEFPAVFREQLSRA